MANGESYTEVLAQVRDRLNDTNDRLNTIDSRITDEVGGLRDEVRSVRVDMNELRNAVNHQQTVAASKHSRQVAVCEMRFGTLEEFKKGVMTIKAAFLWSVATAISVAGISASIAATLVKVLG